MKACRRGGRKNEIPPQKTASSPFKASGMSKPDSDPRLGGAEEPSTVKAGPGDLDAGPAPPANEPQDLSPEGLAQPPASEANLAPGPGDRPRDRWDCCSGLTRSVWSALAPACCYDCFCLISRMPEES